MKNKLDNKAKVSPSPRNTKNSVNVDSQSTNISEAEVSLKIRSIISARRPAFIHQESWRYKRIHASWRKPKGTDSKMRTSRKGWPKIVKIGYGSPSNVRGLHPSGLNDILIHNIKEIEKLTPSTDAARISSTVGLKKRGEILVKAKELHIRVLNPGTHKKMGRKT